MTDPEKKDQLDELLDSVLAEYSSAEPRPGLQTRIVAQVRQAGAAAPSPARTWRWLWAGAMAACAALLIALWIGWRAQVQPAVNNVVRTKEPTAQPALRLENSAPVTTASQENHRPKQRAPLRLQAAGRAVPRQPVFPAPAPLSEQEKLLLSYYAQTPRAELIVQSHPDEPSLVAAAEDQSNIAVPEMIFVPQKSSNTR